MSEDKVSPEEWVDEVNIFMQQRADCDELEQYCEAFLNSMDRCESDARMVAIAKTNLEVAFMWLRRSMC